MRDKEDLKEDVSEIRFGGKIPDSQEAISEQNKAIHDILMTVLQKWLAGVAEKKGAEEEVLTETMIIPAGGLNKISSFLPTQDEREDLPETVIISNSATKRNALKTTTQSQSEKTEPEDKTVILQDINKPRLLKKESKKLPDQDFLTETVILKPKIKKEKRNDGDER